MRHFINRYLIVVLFFFSDIAVSAEVITHIKATSAKSQYHIDFLKFLFKGDRNYSFEEGNELVSRPRQVSDIQDDVISVAAFGTSLQLEEELLPIRLPILKGLLGHRIFIIKKGKQAEFSKINSLTQLKTLKSGQGRTWADTTILKASGFNVITTLKYDNLFPMLEGERFDYFPRAVFEPFSEVAAHSELGLEIEKEIMLVYPLPQYLFVSNNNHKLANAIRSKFEEKIADGSFTEFFLNYRLIIDALTRANLKSRKVYRIDNALLSKLTPLHRPELWMSVDDL
jgi:hypothetical protein